MEKRWLERRDRGGGGSPRTHHKLLQTSSSLFAKLQRRLHERAPTAILHARCALLTPPAPHARSPRHCVPRSPARPSARSFHCCPLCPLTCLSHSLPFSAARARSSAPSLSTVEEFTPSGAIAESISCFSIGKDTICFGSFYIRRRYAIEIAINLYTWADE